MTMQASGISIFNTPPATPAESGEKIRKAAKDFESLFTSIMLKTMRNSVMRSELVPQSMGEKFYTEMLDEEYGGLISGNANLGLADLIVKELERQESRSSGSGLAALQGLSLQTSLIPDSQASLVKKPVDFTGLSQKVGQWDTLIKEASARFNLDPALIAAVIAQESAGNPAATSSAGAKGLMQLIDDTADSMGVQQVYNPRENILGGSKYLRLMLDRFGGDTRLALASYNAGPGAVDRYQGIPPYRETQNYVESVMDYRQRFAAHNTPQVKE
jgi:Rod binding domain-containing protein